MGFKRGLVLTYKIALLGLPYLFKPIKFYVDYSSNLILKGFEVNYSPTLDKWCYTGFGLSVILLSVCHSVFSSVIISFLFKLRTN